MNNNLPTGQNESTLPHLDDLLAIRPEDIKTCIDLGIEIEGTLRVTNGGAILVSGSINGHIESNGSVVINEGATVNGSIRAKSLQVAGEIRAASEDDLLDIEGPIILAQTANITCNAVSAGIKTEFGARMNGRFQPRPAGTAEPRSARPAEPERRASAETSYLHAARPSAQTQREDRPEREVPTIVETVEAAQSAA